MTITKPESAIRNYGKHGYAVTVDNEISISTVSPTSQGAMVNFCFMNDVRVYQTESEELIRRKFIRICELAPDKKIKVQLVKVVLA